MAGQGNAAFRQRPLAAQLGTVVSDLAVLGLRKAFPDELPERLTPEVIRRCIEAGPLARYLPESSEGVAPITDDELDRDIAEQYGEGGDLIDRMVGFKIPRLAESAAT